MSLVAISTGFHKCLPHNFAVVNFRRRSTRVIGHTFWNFRVQSCIFITNHLIVTTDDKTIIANEFYFDYSSPKICQVGAVVILFWFTQMNSPFRIRHQWNGATDVRI